MMLADPYVVALALVQLQRRELDALRAERDDLRARMDAADLALRDLRKADLARIANAIAALRGESPQPPNPEPAPCATCGDQREVCRLCGPMPRGATCLDHHHDEGIPCPSCSASPGGEAR